MNLDLFNSLSNNNKEQSFTLNFINELKEYLNNANKILTDFLSTNELISKYKISNTFSNDFYDRCDKFLEEYSKSLNSEDSFYYVSWNSKRNTDNVYIFRQYEGGTNISQFRLSNKDLPKNVKTRNDTKKDWF